MTLEKVAEMIAEISDLEASEITEETTIADLGIDSLDVAELVLNLENEFGVKLEMDGSLKTVGDIVSKLDELKNA